MGAEHILRKILQREKKYWLAQDLDRSGVLRQNINIFTSDFHIGRHCPNMHTSLKYNSNLKKFDINCHVNTSYMSDCTLIYQSCALPK